MKDIQDIKNKELVNMIVCRKGGTTTAKIIDEIIKRPQNANQLSKKLDLQYNTIVHHMKIVGEKNYVVKFKFNRSYYYYPSKKLLNNMEDYSLIKYYLDEEEE